MKRKFSSKWRVALATAMVIALTLVMAVPVMAGDGSGTCTVSPTEVTAGSTGNTLTFTFTATESMDGEITIEAPANWSAPQGTIETAGYTTATSTGTISTPTFNLQVVTIPITTLADTETITVVYGDGGGDSGATAQETAGTATFVTKSKVAAAAGALVEIAASPEVTVNPDTVAKLAFTADPAGSVSGIAFTTQPTIEAQDQYGNIVDTFADDITISVKTGGGTLLGTPTQAMSNGTLTTGGLGYTATADTEAFTLAANDAGNDLTEGVSGEVTCDVVATKILLTTAPANIISGVSMTQPVVKYVDAQDITDTDITTDVITVTEDGDGTLAGTATATADAGVATFTNLVYTATADGEAVTFTFTDDAAGDKDFSAAPVTSEQTADVVATKILLTTPPANIVSGVSMDQPVVEYVDADEITDTGITTDVITITEDGDGSLAGTTTATAALGVATFDGLVYTAMADGESVTFTFTDDVAGDMDFSAAPVTSAQTADVVATKLVIVTQPDGAVSGVALVLQPVINAVDADGTLDADWVTACAVVKETGTGTVIGGPASMVAGVATFTDVKVTESPVVHGSYTLEFTSGALVAVVSDTFKVYDKVLDLNDDAWTLISTDDYVISSGDDTSAFEGAVSLKYVYTGSSYELATVADIKPVEALYLKTTGTDGLVGLNYSTTASPGASIKALLAGWNLVSSATSTDAGIVLSPLHYVQIGEQEGTGLATLVSQGSYNLTTIDWYIDATTWANVTGTMDPFDGYWVYMNAAKSFGVLPQ